MTPGDETSFPVDPDVVAPCPTGVQVPVFVVLDGIDGCGKTTQAARLVEWLAGAERPHFRKKQPREPLHLREPGSTVLGERLREMLLDPDARIGRGSLALLFAAARRQTLEELVAPALAEGRDVVMERFHASTFAYQGGPGPEGEVGPFNEADLLNMLRRWAGSPLPSHEIILDIDPEDSFGRALAREGGGADRFESRGIEFQRRVAAAMRRYTEFVPGATLVDARGDEDQVAERVRRALQRRSPEVAAEARGGHGG